MIIIANNIVTKEEKEYILMLYHQGLKSVDIAKTVNRHNTTICKVLKSYHIDAKNHHKLSKQDIETIKNLYIEGKTIREIHEIFKSRNVSEGAINYHLKKLGVTRKNGRQVTLNHNYFKVIDTEQKAYFLGLITADGSLQKLQKSKNGYSYVLKLELMYNDKYIIEKLRDELESDLSVKDYKSTKNRNGWKEKHNAYIQFHSEQIFNDLHKFGLDTHKTYTLKQIPNLDDNLMRHYIRGFFDGDGTVYINNNYKKPRSIFGFYGTYEYLELLQEYLINKIGLNRRKIIKKKDEDVCFVAYSTLNNIKSFYNFIYEDATVYLHRKREKFDICLNNN